MTLRERIRFLLNHRNEDPIPPVMRREPMLGTQILRKLQARELYVVSKEQLEAILAELDELYCIQMAATVQPWPPYDPRKSFQPAPAPAPAPIAISFFSREDNAPIAVPIGSATITTEDSNAVCTDNSE